MIQREHIYQAALAKWVETYVIGPKVFLAFDRGKAPGRSKGAILGAKARQRKRGIKAGTPDTLLRVRGFAPIWWECKAPGKEVKDGDDQLKVGLELIEVGDHWGWGITVEQYAVKLVNIGVPLAHGWSLGAMTADAGVTTKIEKAEMREGRLPKRLTTKAEPRFTMGKRATSRARKAGVRV